MSLQFILGSSGAGKTRYLYENLIAMSLKETDRQYIAIVPEQFTMQTQKEIVTLHPQHGTMNIDIVSFNRLAYRVFEELAVTTLSVLDDMGKSMVLRKVTGDQRRNLRLFKGHINQNGFIDQLKSLISELCQYGIQVEAIQEAADESQNALLKEKLRDLAVIYQGFKDEIKERYITTEEILDVLCRVLPRSKMIKNSIVTLDGYTGFTPVQYRLIELLLTYARKVTVTITIDPAANPYKEGRLQNLFYMSKRIVCRLTDIASNNGFHKEQDIVLGRENGVLKRFVDSPAIGFLEKHLYRYDNAVYGEEPHELLVCQAGRPGEEIAWVAGRIHRLVQTEGVRYREIAVITGDLPAYGHEIANQFRGNQIPFFMDDKKCILENVLVELVRAALEVVQKDFSYESVFRYLKTGLVTDRLEMIDRLENYVVALGIRGFKRWNQIWEWKYRGSKHLNLTELNQFREEILKPLGSLREALREEQSTVRTMAEAVRDCLEEWGVQQKLKDYKEYFEESGEYSLAKEYEQVYALVLDLLDRLVYLLGNESVSRKEFAEILDAGFAEISVGVIPATVDRVVVGDITRTRLDEIKVLFFVGVNDGIVPMKKHSAGILTDTDRTVLKNFRMELAPTSKEDGFMQRFYLYLMMTKPKMRLILSYSAFDSSGKILRPSSLIGEVRRMFPALDVQDGKKGQLSVGSAAEGLEYLIRGLRDYENCRNDGMFLEIYRLFARSEEDQDNRNIQVRRLVDAAFYSYEDRGIGRAAARALYGNILQGSVTRLEKFAACAYAHFLNYGLELMERQKYQLEAVDMGNLFHNSIDLCFKELGARGQNPVALTEGDRKALVKSCVRQVTTEYGNTILLSSARNQYLARKVERITDRTMWALIEQLKKGDFTPAGFEVSFSAIDNLKAMKISLSEESSPHLHTAEREESPPHLRTAEWEQDSIHLRGRIDRLDLCEDEEHVYVKIIDYKSGSTRFDLTALYYGLQLQLVVYMDAVLEMEERKNPNKQVVPAGVFYYNIKDPMVEKQTGITGDEIDSRILEQLKMNGLVNSDLEVVRHLDREIEKKSDVIPVAMKNGLIQESYSTVASQERFQVLKDYVRNQLKRSGRDILNGAASVKPYKQGAGTACDYCPYHSVCGFDQKTPGYGFRRFQAMKPEQVWEQLIEEMNMTELKAAELSGPDSPSDKKGRQGKEETENELDTGAGTGHMVQRPESAGIGGGRERKDSSAGGADYPNDN